MAGGVSQAEKEVRSVTLQEKWVTDKMETCYCLWSFELVILTCNPNYQTN